MAIRTIHLPHELNEEMKKRRDVNWSAVAAAAFVLFLKEDEDIVTILERIKQDADKVKASLG